MPIFCRVDVIAKPSLIQVIFSFYWEIDDVRRYWAYGGTARVEFPNPRCWPDGVGDSAESVVVKRDYRKVTTRGPNV